MLNNTYIIDSKANACKPINFDMLPDHGNNNNNNKFMQTMFLYMWCHLSLELKLKLYLCNIHPCSNIMLCYVLADPLEG